VKNKSKTNELFNKLIDKATLKQKVYHNTLDSLNFLKKSMAALTSDYDSLPSKQSKRIPFIYNDLGEFEAELKFAADTLVFMMHSNVFEIPRDHEVMKSPYIKEDKERSYCGIINIFNFLSDSFKYNRLNDVGYLIGRVHVNKDMHYFTEGKREIGFLYNSFGVTIMDEKSASEILHSAIYYTINFDLLTPPYNEVKEVTVMEFISAVDAMHLKTGKRLGFKFQADKD
jgi:hypothetical protein